MGGSIITATDKLKYLDVIIDDKITWIPHITYVKNKVSKGSGIMFKVRNYLKRNALVNLYYYFIYPYLIYCIEAWGNYTRQRHLLHVNKSNINTSQTVLVTQVLAYGMLFSPK